MRRSWAVVVALVAMLVVAPPAGAAARGVTVSTDVSAVQTLPLDCASGGFVLWMTNESSKAVYADAWLSVPAPFELSRTLVTSYLPAGYTLKVPVYVSVPPGTSAESATVAIVSGRSRTEVAVSVRTDVGGWVARSETGATATSWQADYEAGLAVDGSCTTMWHTQWSPYEPLPQSITLDLGASRSVAAIAYTPRQDGNQNGFVTDYRVAVSSDGDTYTRVASGRWVINRATKVAKLSTPAEAQFVRLTATAGYRDYAWAADLRVAVAGN